MEVCNDMVYAIIDCRWKKILEEEGEKERKMNEIRGNSSIPSQINSEGGIPEITTDDVSAGANTFL